MAKASGGDLRDFFRLVRECPNMLSIARLNDPVAELTGEMVRRAEDALRNDFLPIAEADARWLARIHQSKQAALPSTDDLPTLARFFDTNLILNYVNGEPWYDIHPLLNDEIKPFLEPADNEDDT